MIKLLSVLFDPKCADAEYSRICTEMEFDYTVSKDMSTSIGRVSFARSTDRYIVLRNFGGAS